MYKGFKKVLCVLMAVVVQFASLTSFVTGALPVTAASYPPPPRFLPM